MNSSGQNPDCVRGCTHTRNSEILHRPCHSAHSTYCTVHKELTAQCTYSAPSSRDLFGRFQDRASGGGGGGLGACVCTRAVSQ